MKRAADQVADLLRRLEVRTVYADLDGTLLGPGGSLFAGSDGVTVEPASAVAALARRGIDLVPVSGRTREQVREVSRLLGGRAFIAEIGGLVVYLEEGEEITVRNEGAARGASTAYRAIERSGAGGFLLDAYSGRLEPHTPWAFLERECSMLLRGGVDVDEARERLRSAGYGWLDLQDNGIIPNGRQRFPWLELESVHAYHLVPSGVSKRSAIALDRTRRGLRRESCLAVGDSRSDAEVAPEVGAVFIVANGAPSIRDVPLADNVYVTDRSHGAGFAEAVLPFAGSPEPLEAPPGRTDGRS